MASKRKVKAGNVVIGGGEKIAIQSMLNIPAHNIEDSVKQAKALEKAGCDIVRAAVPDMEAVKLISALKENISIPLLLIFILTINLLLSQLQQVLIKSELIRVISVMIAMLRQLLMLVQITVFLLESV